MFDHREKPLAVLSSPVADRTGAVQRCSSARPRMSESSIASRGYATLRVRLVSYGFLIECRQRYSIVYTFSDVDNDRSSMSYF